jgi:hypothetical protein
LLRILVFVQAVGRGLPDIYLSSHHGLPRAVYHPAAYKQGRAWRGAAHDGATVGRGRAVQSPKGAEQVLGSGVLALAAVIEQAHQLRHPQRTSHEHGLVVGVSAALANLVDDGGGLAKLGFCQTRLSHKTVQVLDQHSHDLAQTWIGGALHHNQNSSCDVRGSLDRLHGVV